MGRTALRVILAFNIVSTGLHFTHNYLRIEQYPQTPAISAATTQVAILVSWPVLTIVGLIGYAMYVRGRYPAAHGCLLVYSLAGLVTPAHFLAGVPQTHWFWFTTIFTDAIGGLALWVFVVSSSIEVRKRQPVA